MSSLCKPPLSRERLGNHRIRNTSCFQTIEKCSLLICFVGYFWQDSYVFERNFALKLKFNGPENHITLVYQGWKTSCFNTSLSFNKVQISSRARTNFAKSSMKLLLDAIKDMKIAWTKMKSGKSRKIREILFTLQFDEKNNAISGRWDKPKERSGLNF